MFKKAIATALALAALSACDAPSQPGYYGGTAPINAAQAVGFYDQICAANARDMSAARATMGTMPFVRNSDEDIYYHRTLNLSFKITPTQGQAVCSMVWVPSDGVGRAMNVVQTSFPAALLRDNQDGTVTAFLYGAL